MYLVGLGIGDLDLGGASSEQIEPVCAVDFSSFLSAFRRPQEQPRKSGKGVSRLSRASVSLGGGLLLASLAWKVYCEIVLCGKAIYW